MIAAIVTFAVLTALAAAAFRAYEGKLPAEKKIRDSYGISEADRKPAHILRMVWAVFGAAAFFALVFLFYDANQGGNAEAYGRAAKFLVFNDDWGTNRGYAWKLALKYFKNLPFFKKLIGSGPETFSIHVLLYDLNTTLRKYEFNFDSVHNEWLQHLLEEGIIGFISYYGMNIACIIAGFRAKTVTAAAFSFAVLVYILQSVISISVPIVLPIAMVCMAAAAAAERVEIREKQ